MFDRSALVGLENEKCLCDLHSVKISNLIEINNAVDIGLVHKIWYKYVVWAKKKSLGKYVFAEAIQFMSYKTIIFSFTTLQSGITYQP